MAIGSPSEKVSQLQDIRLCSKYEFILPQEIRRLICDFVEQDIEALKSLRLASKSWALTGFEFLLRETFVIKFDLDIDRLINVTSEARWSYQAGKTVKAVQIQSSQWVPSHIRRKLLERVLGDRSGTLSLFCQEAQEAFDELNKASKQRPSTQLNKLCLAYSLSLAFKQLPRIHTIDFAFPNPFKHTLLRNIWNETVLLDYQTPPLHVWVIHLKNVLLAVREANLGLQNFTYSQASAFCS